MMKTKRIISRLQLHCTGLLFTGLLCAGYIFIGLFTSISALANVPTEVSEPACPTEHQIDVTFASGSGWQLCWDSRLRENIVLSNIHYQPSVDAASIPVLNSIRLSQLHVAYDDSPVTYSDVTQYGLGERNISQLNPSDCPSGELLSIDGVPGLCKRTVSADDSTASGFDGNDSLILYSTSQVGSYAYLVTWQFFADGSIRPSVGAAGALQRSSDEPETAHGRHLGNSTDKVWLSHTHNYYWRLDFDIGDSAFDDRVIEWVTAPDDTGALSNQYHALTEESALKMAPDSLLSWFIADDSSHATDARGFLIEPVNNGHRFVRESIEPYTAFDFFVTRQKDCERFATDNEKYNPGCTDNVLDFSNGESLVDADIVVWHRVSFHHVPRNEDLESMHSHWDGFTLKARNFGYRAGHAAPYAKAFPDHDHNASHHLEHESLAAALPAQLVANRRNQVGDAVSVDITSPTAPAETHRYSAAGLPAGIELSPTGMLTGKPTHPGTFDVTVRIDSPQNVTTTYAFEWVVNDTPLGCSIRHTPTGDYAGGSIEWWLLLVLLYWRNRTIGWQKQSQDV